MPLPRPALTALLATAVLALGLTAACGSASSESAPSGVPRHWLSDGRLTAFTFLSIECPLSQNYTKTLNELAKRYTDVAFVGVFPLADDDEARVDGFREDFAVSFPTRLDHGYELVEALEPGVTPEVFLVDAAARVVYSGKIDNWAVELGRTRAGPATEHYLEDAIRAHGEGLEPPLSRVEPVGCFLPKEPYDARSE